MEYKSCNLLEHGLCFYSTDLCSCCYAPQDGAGRAPYIYPFYRGQVIDTDFLFKKINKWRENIIASGLYPLGCMNCYKLEHKNWSDDYYIDNIYITHFNACNLNCVYCINKKQKDSLNIEPYKVLPVLNDLKNKGILRQGCEFHIGGGEFSIYSECDDIINDYVLSGFTHHLAIATNAVRYSESIFNAMKEDRASIIISVDCGSKNLYKKIKCVDAFDKLSENIKLYTGTEKSRQNTYLKYIVVPKINDNKKEFIKFLEYAAKYDIKGIKIDLDGNYCRKHYYKPEKRILEFMKYIINLASNKGFEVETFSFYNQCLSDL